MCTCVCADVPAYIYIYIHARKRGRECLRARASACARAHVRTRVCPRVPACARAPMQAQGSASPRPFQLQPRPLGRVPGAGSLPLGSAALGADGEAALASLAGRLPAHRPAFQGPRAVPMPPTWAGEPGTEPQSRLCAAGWARVDTCTRVHACARARASLRSLRWEYCDRSPNLPGWHRAPPPPPCAPKYTAGSPAPAAGRGCARPFPSTPWRSGRKSGN